MPLFSKVLWQTVLQEPIYLATNLSEKRGKQIHTQKNSLPRTDVAVSGSQANFASHVEKQPYQ